MYKILFTGTYYSGKTLVVDHFSKYKNILVISETARNVLKDHPGLQSKPEFQDILFEAQICLEKLAELQNPSFIFCDRGILDIKAYSLFYKHPLKINIPLVVKPYDFTFLCSPFDIDVDLILSKKERKDRIIIHKLFLKLLKKEGQNFEILSGDLESRIKAVKKIIKQYDKNFLLQK